MSNTKIFIKGEVRIYITDATEIAQKAMDFHKTLPLASLVLSTSIATFSLFSSLHTEGRTSIRLNGNGPLKTILVETNCNGDIRALVGEPKIATEFDKTRINDIPLTLGIGDSGTIKVVREVNGKNFGGEVVLANADVVTDLAYYFDQSEQIHTAIISDVKLKDQKTLERAYSVFFQMLPNHSETDIKWVEEFIDQNKLSKMTLETYIKNLDAKKLIEKKIQWNCTCSTEKMKELIKLINPLEQKEIIKEHGHIEVMCNYCRKKYQIE